MRDEAFKRIGHLYPKVQLPKEQGGGEATIIAWLWARTVKCPNPACGAQMPLISSFALSTKKGKEAWIEPIIDKAEKKVKFEIKTGSGKMPESPKLARGAKFSCLVCGQPAEEQHIKAEGMAKQMGSQLLAVVAEGKGGRLFLPATTMQEVISTSSKPNWMPEEELPYEPRAIWCTLYGFKVYKDLFTNRQLIALTTFSDLVEDARQQVLKDYSIKTGQKLEAEDYANSIATYLALVVSKSADYWSSFCIWRSDPKNLGIGHVFARQGIQMVWDYAEANIFSDSSGNWLNNLEWTVKVIENLFPGNLSRVLQNDAATFSYQTQFLISTDPPYYDNIGYADLSDFFYVWLRRALQRHYPNIMGTLLVPKTTELIASPYRFEGNKQKAQKFFEEGLEKAFTLMRNAAQLNYPLTIYYAFKQSEKESDVKGTTNGVTTSSTGWETMLEGLIRSGFNINGTWPVRTELANRSIGQGNNALASSIVLACRQRSENAPVTSRREFLVTLKRELPNALRNLQHGNIAPVDLAQASIGPGMAVFSRYAKVLESDGKPMRVRTALQLINQVLDEVLAEQEGDYDADTRWAIAWFEQHGQSEGLYGDAETLSKAKNTSVQGLVEAGVLQAKAGKVRLLRREELTEDWDPYSDRRLTIWEITQYLIRALDKEGEVAAANLLAKLGEKGEIARALAYRLYSTCERKGWAQEALAYNTLVVSWAQTSQLAAQVDTQVMRQGRLL